MANIRLIKNRIRSAKNIAQITRAMELVAASKMKKAQAEALSGKLYAQKIFDMMMRLSPSADSVQHPLLTKPALTGKRLVIVIATNKGLCGGLNTNLFRFFLREFADSRAYECVTIGKKAATLFTQLGKTIQADFSDTVPFTHSVPALTELVSGEFLSGGYDGVDIVYQEFFSALSQIPRKKTLLPLTMTANGDRAKGSQEQSTPQFLIEPSATEVFEALLPHFLENQVRDAILQAEASEHSARMVAMRSATDNALSLMDDLTLVYNKARQEKITYEISDIVTARLSVED